MSTRIRHWVCVCGMWAIVRWVSAVAQAPADACFAAFFCFFLFSQNRNVSGTRVLCGGKQQTIASISFQDYGCHAAGYPHPYMNAAAAIGGSKQEVDVFLGRLVKAYRELQEKWGGGGGDASRPAAAAQPSV